MLDAEAEKCPEYLRAPEKWEVVHHMFETVHFNKEGKCIVSEQKKEDKITSCSEVTAKEGDKVEKDQCKSEVLNSVAEVCSHR